MQTQKKTSTPVELRALDDNGMEQVFALYAEVFGHGYAQRFRRRWQWSLRENLSPDETRRWVLAAGERVVGFLAAMPMTYAIGGERLVAHTPCDYMVHADYRFHGIKLMKQFFKECPNCVTCDDIEATIKITEWLGAQAVGPVNTYLKLLNGRALAGRGQFAGLPWFAFGAITQALKVADVLLFLRTSRLKLEKVSPSDERFDRFFKCLSQNVPAAVAKDRRFLEWRYGKDSPQAQCEIIAALDRAGEFQGYAVLFVADAPRTSGYVLDLQALPGSGHGVEKALLKHAVRRLRKMGALTVRYHALPSPYAPPDEILKRLGFAKRNVGRRILMAKLEDARLAEIAGSASSWRYSLGDAEVSHSLE